VIWQEKHIPFRDSKLTHILQDSLGGQAKTMMFVNISPSGKGEDANETESSLRFATRVRKIELGAAKRQVDNSDMVKYKKMYEDVMVELDGKDGEINNLKASLRLNPKPLSGSLPPPGPTPCGGGGATDPAGDAGAE
jgi:kinesin family protein C2/C3